MLIKNSKTCKSQRENMENNRPRVILKSSQSKCMNYFLAKKKGQALNPKPNHPNKPRVSFFPASKSVCGVSVINI